MRLFGHLKVANEVALSMFTGVQASPRPICRACPPPEGDPAPTKVTVCTSPMSHLLLQLHRTPTPEAERGRGGGRLRGKSLSLTISHHCSLSEWPVFPWADEGQVNTMESTGRHLLGPKAVLSGKVMLQTFNPAQTSGHSRG